MNTGCFIYWLLSLWFKCHYQLLRGNGKWEYRQDECNIFVNAAVVSPKNAALLTLLFIEQNVLKLPLLSGHSLNLTSWVNLVWRYGKVLWCEIYSCYLKAFSFCRIAVSTALKNSVTLINAKITTLKIKW